MQRPDLLVTPHVGVARISSEAPWYRNRGCTASNSTSSSSYSKPDATWRTPQRNRRAPKKSWPGRNPSACSSNTTPSSCKATQTAKPAAPRGNRRGRLNRSLRGKHVRSAGNTTSSGDSSRQSPIHRTQFGNRRSAGLVWAPVYLLLSNTPRSVSGNTSCALL